MLVITKSRDSCCNFFSLGTVMSGFAMNREEWTYVFQHYGITSTSTYWPHDKKYAASGSSPENSYVQGILPRRSPMDSVQENSTESAEKTARQSKGAFKPFLCIEVSGLLLRLA